ncbi:hypothetical protein CYMTET_10630, partial [Cymbomonas tetramitiformis]
MGYPTGPESCSDDPGCNPIIGDSFEGPALQVVYAYWLLVLFAVVSFHTWRYTYKQRNDFGAMQATSRSAKLDPTWLAEPINGDQ